MNNTKEKNVKLQIKISVVVLTLIIFAELFIISLGLGHIPVIILAIIGAAAVFVFVSAVMTWDELKETKRQEYLENICKSEKATYIMLKKSFDEMEQKLDMLQESSKVSTEEIINAQKGVAKVIVNRNKENADAIIQSNDQAILRDILVQIKETEVNLNQSIQDAAKAIEKIKVSSYIAAPVEKVEEEISVIKETSKIEETPIIEEVPAIEGTPAVEEVPVVEETPVVEEKVAAPDISDPNKMMSPDDIAALLASMNAEEPAAPVVEETPIVEEKPAMPDLSDPNKVMSPDEIAALIANL